MANDRQNLKSRHSELRMRRPRITIVAIAATICLLCLALYREFAVTGPRSLDDVFREHQPPLFAAREARVEKTRWTLGDGYWPYRAGRLVTVGFHAIETREQAQKLSGEVLIYCSEPAPMRGSGDLTLRVHGVDANMAQSSQFLGREGPNGKLLNAAPELLVRSLPLSRPIKVTLVFLDENGHVRRAERHEVIELVHAALHK
jgi:hypothetical protein